MPITSWAEGFKPGTRERALAEAIEALDQVGVSAALEDGANSNAADPKSGWTALHFVAGFPPLSDDHDVESEVRGRLYDLLKAHGANVNAADRKGLTPLDVAYMTAASISEQEWLMGTRAQLTMDGGSFGPGSPTRPKSLNSAKRAGCLPLLLFSVTTCAAFLGWRLV